MVDFSSIFDAFYVISICFNSIVSVLGDTFISVIYFAITLSALISVLGFCVSLDAKAESRKNKKSE